VAGGALLAISVFALFWVPPLGSETARTLYVGAALLFYASAYTVFNIPYMAMPAEMTTAYHQRTELMSWRVIAVGLAQIIAMFLGVAMVDWFGGGARGHLGMAAVLAPVVMASAVVCFFMTRQAPYTLASTTHAPFMVQARSVLDNRPYLVLIGVKLLTLTSLSAQSVFPYFFQRILGVSNVYLGTYFAVASVALIASQPAWIWISRRLGKSLCYRIALGLSIPAFLSWLLAGAGDPLWSILARGAAIGFAGGGALLMGQSLLPDTMEYDHLRTGLRREGIFAGFYTTVEKVAGAVGIALVGAILSAAGYVQSRGIDVVQPESALTAIRLVIALLPAGVSLAALLLLFGYTLSEERLQALRRSAPA
jgi:GPH family glycoside/pentoside/hexuronide:cation symporter